MKTYRFSTRITARGTIEIPEMPELLDKEVEVIIVSIEEGKRQQKNARLFVEKWAGFLQDSDTDKAKFEYLSEKHK